MSEVKPFTADGYPVDRSEIVTDATGFGYIDALFEDALYNFGNDEAVTWPSYTENDVMYRVRYDGQGIVVREGRTWPIWLLEMTRVHQSKILKIDIATCSSKIWTSEGFVRGRFIDNSDLIAAVLNLKRFTDERLDEGDGQLAVFRREMKKALNNHQATTSDYQE